jgi:hypothetical protein
MKHRRLRHQFVHYVPEVLEEGILYISLEYKTAVHKCCCGCGSEVVTPLSQTDWALRFDGETISLEPSVGNWSLPCQSHYWIDRNLVRPARKWTREEITEARGDAKRVREAYYGKGDRMPAGSDESARPRPLMGKDKDRKKTRD